MAGHFRRGRLSKGDFIRRTNAYKRFISGALPEDKRESYLEKALVQEPKRREIRRPVDGERVVPLEKEIQTAILEAIELRKDVVFVGRFNRGQAVATDSHGNTRYTPFNSVPGFPDIHGLLVGGRAFYIEVKRPPPCYKKPDEAQQKFLDEARVGGACAGVATSVEEAIALLS